MAIPVLNPDLDYAERLAVMADAARRHGQADCADRLLLLAWTALDEAEHDLAGRNGAGAARHGVTTLPTQV